MSAVLQRSNVGSSVVGLSTGQLELVKWIAAAAMVADHLNKLVFSGALPGFTEFGRLAFPLFAATLALSVASMNEDKLFRIAARVLAVAVVTQPIYIWAWGWWQLNAMFTLAFGLFVYWWIRDRECDRVEQICYSVLLSAIGMFAEFWAIGVWVVVAACLFVQRPTGERFVAWFFLVGCLVVINGNLYALCSFVVLVAAAVSPIGVPRWRHWLYWFYPLHLVPLALL